MTNSGSTSLRWSRNGSSTAVAVARRLISHRACLLACLLAILAAGMFAAHDATAQETPAPAVSSVSLSSAPASGDTYQRGDTIEVRVDFDRLVAVTGTPRVAVTVGTRTRSAALDRTAGPRSSASSLFFKYTVVEEDSDTDGVSIAANSISLNGGSIKAVADGTTDAHLTAVLDDATRKVDGLQVTGPVVTAVRFIGTPASGNAYQSGETIKVQVWFDRLVNVSGRPTVELTIGNRTRQATLRLDSVRVGVQGLGFRYTVQAHDADADGISIAADSIRLNGATITATDDSTDAVLTHPAVPADTTRKVGSGTAPPPSDGPAVSSVFFGSSPAGGATYERGETIDVRVLFTESIAVTGSPSLALAIGGQTRAAAFYGTHYSRAASFRYTVAAADRDADGISVAANAISLDGGSITSYDGSTDAVLEHAAVADDAGRRVNGSQVTAPAVSGVSITSRPRGGTTYGRGESIVVEVRFSEPVTVTGSPRLALTVGTATRSAGFSRFSGSTLWFGYRVQADDSDSDGIGIAAGALTLNGGTILDAAGNPANLSLATASTAAGHNVDGGAVQETVPTRAAVTSQPRNGEAYGNGESVDVEIRFNKEVAVAGQPQLELTIGPQPASTSAARAGRLAAAQATTRAVRRVATFVSAANERLHFRYVVQAGDDSGGGGISFTDNALRLNGATITDAAGWPLDRNNLSLDTAQVVQGDRVDGTLNAERTPEYLLTVTATPHDSGAALHLSVRIAIVDADDRVVVVLSTMQPYVGEEVIASLADPDGGVRAGSVTWQWWRRTYRGDWAVIPGATAAGYTPVAADVDHHLQARVSYRGQDGARRAASRQTDLVGLQPARRLRMLQIGLAGFGRTVAATAVQVIGQRFAPMTRPGAGPDALDLDVTLNGRSLGLSEAGDVEARGELVSTVAEALGIRVQSGGGGAWDAPSAAQLIADSAFTVGGASGHGARWGVWGSGALSRFSGDIDGFRQDGTVHSVYLGADYRFVPSALAGLAASHSALELTSASRIEGDATLEATLGTVYPYLYWMPTEWLGIWGVAGLGRGTSEFTPVGGSFLSPGFLESWLGAAGQRTELWSGGSVSLAAKSDGFVTGIRQSFLGVIERFRGGGGGDPPRQVSVHAWRARVLVEAGLESRPQDALVSALVELGARLDGGDAEQGLGAEAGAELSYTHTGIGLGLTGRGRLLLVHEDRNIRDWGASATLTWAPPNDGPGPAVSVAPG